VVDDHRIGAGLVVAVVEQSARLVHALLLLAFLLLPFLFLPGLLVAISGTHGSLLG
jgi:hypothetical protein